MPAETDLAHRGEAGPVAAETDLEVRLVCHWGAQTIPLEFSRADWDTTTLWEMKLRLDAEVNVPYETMKLFGVSGPNGRAPSDSDLLGHLVFPTSGQFVLVGTARQARVVPVAAECGSAGVAVVRDDLIVQRLQAAIRKTDIQTLHAPRQGRKLLVLDLDFTVFDCKSTAPIATCKRPFTDELLTAVFPHYDIAVWSQTRWHWVEAKLTDMGFLTHGDFHISFCMDRSSMFSVTSTDPAGQQHTHEVKALEVIWAKFPCFGPHNTVHVDDYPRNFALNPRSGIVVSPYRVNQRAGDVELKYLTTYLMSLVAAPNLAEVDHSKWRNLFT